MNPLRTLKDLARHALQRRGYELYRRPYLPRGVDAVETLRANFPSFQPRVIFDVGANVGQTVQRLKPLFPDAQIHAFEPIPAIHAQLRANAAKFHNVFPHALALADRAGHATITLQSSSELNSLNPTLTPAPGAEAVKIQLETLDAFCDRAGIGHIDLLKLDVEGLELSVLQGARGHLASGAVDFVLAECGLMPGEPRFTPLSDMIAALQPHHFWLAGIFEQRGWKYFRGAEFCDALFALEKHLA